MKVPLLDRILSLSFVSTLPFSACSEQPLLVLRVPHHLAPPFSSFTHLRPLCSDSHCRQMSWTLALSALSPLALFSFCSPTQGTIAVVQRLLVASLMLRAAHSSAVLGVQSLECCLTHWCSLNIYFVHEWGSTERLAERKQEGSQGLGCLQFVQRNR